MGKLVAAHTRALEDERKIAEERYALLRKDYEFLKCSFRPYKDSVLNNFSMSEEEQERCLKKQLLWLKEQLKQNEEERERESKSFQSETAKLRSSFKAEVEGLKNQLKEKDVTISSLRAILHQASGGAEQFS
ncbi:hypothetical protein Baya_8326 [Bagarius yarrelli]|uniref:Uncharacterized protein n=1 Tax=Bagarius yarrelli TaxID=175774 RepID=A0A556U4P1_BAGYA|nr:hypothetical protein Baya_8326 [Bagarius yarrelli]